MVLYHKFLQFGRNIPKILACRKFAFPTYNLLERVSANIAKRRGMVYPSRRR